MGCGGGRRNTPGPGGGAPGAGGRAISLPWSQVRVLIAPSGSARMRRVRAPAPGRALPARGEGPPGRAAGGALDQGRPSRWPRFLLMIRPRPPPSSPVVNCQGARPVNRMPTTRGLTTRRMGVRFCAPRRRGQHDPVFYEVLHRDGVWIHVHSRLVADRAPVGCWGASTWRPTPLHASALRRPLIWRGVRPRARSDTTRARTTPGSASRARSLGRARRRAAMRPASPPAAPVGARVALDPAPDHRRGPAKHSGDARLTTQTPAPHRSQPGPTCSKADDNPHPTPLNQENCLHPMTPPTFIKHLHEE